MLILADETEKPNYIYPPNKKKNGKKDSPAIVTKKLFLFRYL